MLVAVSKSHFSNVQELDDLHDLGAELGVSTLTLKSQSERLRVICVISCKAKLIYHMYSACNSDKVTMKKHAISISNALAVYEREPELVSYISPQLKAIKKFQFVAPKLP